MKNESYKIAIGFFVVLFTAIVYLTFALESAGEQNIAKIEIEGNVHLDDFEYKQFAGLVDKSEFDKLTLQIIRDRIQRHPYVKTAVVEIESSGEVKVIIDEKDFKAHVLTDSRDYLLSKDVEILPLLNNTKKLDYPIIRLNDSETLRHFNFPKSNEGIERAYKILSAAEFLNPGLYDNLSEVDLRNDENTIIYFSSVDYPVVLGAENEIKKMVVFEKLWESISTVQASKLLDYVDLRFKNKVYLGITGEEIQVEETQS